MLSGARVRMNYPTAEPPVMGRAPSFQLRSIPGALKMKPSFWSHFTFMCKWVYFEADHG